MYDLESLDKRLIIFGNLFRVANRLQSRMDAQMRDLTAKQWFVILMLEMFDAPPTLGQLAQASDSSHQNTKQLALKLQEKGFVRILSDPDDARAMRIIATDKCDAWDKENKEIAAAFVEAMFQGMTQAEIETLNGSLFTIYDNLEGRK